MWGEARVSHASTRPWAQEAGTLGLLHGRMVPSLGCASWLWCACARVGHREGWKQYGLRARWRLPASSQAWTTATGGLAGGGLSDTIAASTRPLWQAGSRNGAADFSARWYRELQVGEGVGWGSRGLSRRRGSSGGALLTAQC